MNNEFLKKLLDEANTSLKQQAISLGNAEDGNAILSYRRVIQHLSDFIPRLYGQLQSAATDKGGIENGDDAWWRAHVPGLDFSIELERRYFDREADRDSPTGHRRADVILEIRRGTRRVRILIEYKTSQAGTDSDPAVLESAFEEQLIPYLSHEVAHLVRHETDITDQFFCCIAVSLRDHGKLPDSGDEKLDVTPDLAYALLRSASLPSLRKFDHNQLCYFVFEPWSAQPNGNTFESWLLAMITDRLFEPTLGVQGTESILGAPRPERELCIVFGPPGSGKTHWVLDHYSDARIFAPEFLKQQNYRHGSDPTSSCIVIDEWQHMGLTLVGKKTNELTAAIAGEWKKLIAVVDLGQAREDNKSWPEDSYEKIPKIVQKYQPASFTTTYLPLWIPLRQRQLGVAFMLWLEAVRRALTRKDTLRKTGFHISPGAAAKAFKNARQILARQVPNPQELFDITIIKRSQLELKWGGLHIKDIGRADILLRKKLSTNLETDDQPDMLKPFRALPVQVAGMEFDHVIVNLENSVYQYSNEINEMLLACSRARRRLCLLVDEDWKTEASLTDEQKDVFDRYDLFGIHQLHSLDQR